MKGFEVSACTCGMSSLLPLSKPLQDLWFLFLVSSFLSITHSSLDINHFSTFYPLHQHSVFLSLSFSFSFLSLPLIFSPFLPPSSFYSSLFFPPLPPSLSPLPKVYVVELMESIDLCVERNIHNRTQDEIEKVLVLQLL